MDEYGRLTPAVNRFPSAEDGKGFKPLADYVHSLGMRFGIHIMRGIPKMAVKENSPVLGTDLRASDIADTSSTCPWNPDMYGVDATTPLSAGPHVMELANLWRITDDFWDRRCAG